MGAGLTCTAQAVIDRRLDFGGIGYHREGLTDLRGDVDRPAGGGIAVDPQRFRLDHRLAVAHPHEAVSARRSLRVHARHPGGDHQFVAGKSRANVFDVVRADHPGRLRIQIPRHRPALLVRVGRGNLLHPAHVLLIVDVAVQVDRLGGDGKSFGEDSGHCCLGRWWQVRQFTMRSTMGRHTAQ